MISEMTAKYFEARIREGQEFNYLGWFERVQGEKSEAKAVGTTVIAKEFLASETANPTNNSGRQEAEPRSTPPPLNKTMPLARPSWRSDDKARSRIRQTRMRRRLERVCRAWNKFQATRVRKAVYGYLTAVFEIVERYNRRRKTEKLLRYAFKCADLAVDGKADPFTAVIRCTCYRNTDNKTISKWARALRYVAQCKKPGTGLKRFMEEAGGINGCAERYARWSSSR